MDDTLTLEALAARVQQLEADVKFLRARRHGRVRDRDEDRRLTATGYPYSLTEEQITLARRMRADGRMAGEIFRALNEMPGGRLKKVEAAKELFRRVSMPLGPRQCVVRPVAVPWKVFARPAPVPAAPASQAAPTWPANGEARWADCVRYCRHYDLPLFDGDMLAINRHLAKRGQQEWVLVEPFGPARAAVPEARA